MGEKRAILVVLLRESERERDWDRHLFRQSVPSSVYLIFANAYRSVPMVELTHVGGVIIGGSALSVFEDLPNAPRLHAIVKACHENNVPLLGVCFGAQLIAHALGGSVTRDAEAEEHGHQTIRLREEAQHDVLLGDLPEGFRASCDHQDHITCLPEGAIHLASSERCHVHAFRMTGSRVWGVQFHPERSETPEAAGLIRTFVERAVLARGV